MPGAFLFLQSFKNYICRGMVTISALRRLTTQKLKDAETLIRHGRNSGGVYLAGYALEYSLKRKICDTLNFTNGFPEYKSEFNTYAAALTTPTYVLPVAKLSEIKNHDLPKLLFYSGIQYSIITGFLNEWSAVASWNPEDRYKVHRYTSDKAIYFLRATKTLVRHLI